MWFAGYLVLHKDELSVSDGGGGGSADAPPPPPPTPDIAAMMAAAQSGIMLPSFSMPEVSGAGGFLLKDWTVTGGEFFASKEWIKEDPGLGLVERGTFKLYHRPPK